MTWGTLLAYCLAKPGAWQDEPWESDVVAKVGGKIFAFFGSGDTPSVGLKCGASREAADEWLLRYPRTRHHGLHRPLRVEHAADRRRDPDDELSRRSTPPTRPWSANCRRKTVLDGRRDGLDRVAGGDFVT
jgi:hypothetical protein